MKLKHDDACWKLGFSLCAAAALALGLGGCDSKQSPESARAPASAAAPDPAGDAIGPIAGPGPAPATASAAAPVPPAAERAPALSVKGNEFRRVYVAREGDAQLQSLESMLGKYPHDAGKYLEKGVLADRLKRLLDSRYAMVLKNLEVSGPLTREGDVWSIVGNRKHQGGIDAAAIVIDPARNGLRVWSLRRGTQTSYTDLPEGEIPWPESVRTMIGNLSSAPARK